MCDEILKSTICSMSYRHGNEKYKSTITAVQKCADVQHKCNRKQENKPT